MASNNNLHNYMPSRPRHPPGLSFIPINQQATTVPDNAVLTDRQEPASCWYNIVRTLATNTPPPGTTIQVQEWCHALFSDARTGGLFHGTFPVRPSFFDTFRQTAIEVTGFELCGQVIKHVNHNLLFPINDPDTMAREYTGNGSNVHFHWQDILGEREFAAGSDAAMRHLRNEIAVAEVLDHPRYRDLDLNINLTRYLGVCVDPFKRVNCTAWAPSMATLHDFVVSDHLLLPNLVQQIYDKIYAGMRQMHSLGISHGAINEKNVYLTFQRCNIERKSNGTITRMPFVRVTEVVLGNFERAVDHAVNCVVESEIESAMVSDERQLEVLFNWVRTNIRAQE